MNRKSVKAKRSGTKGLPAWRLDKSLRPGTVFAAISEFGHDEDFEPKEPSEPTKAAAGSQEKIAVMVQRLERGESCFAKGDYYAEGEFESADTPRIMRAFVRRMKYAGFENERA